MTLKSDYNEWSFFTLKFIELMYNKYFHFAWFVFLSFLVFSGCMNKTQENGNTVVVNLPSEYSNKLISDYLQLSDIVCLETTDSSLIKDIRRVIIHDGRIFIQNGREEVLSFDEKGKFINKICNKGVGPGEYTNIMDIAVDRDRDNIILYVDNLSAFIYGLDGTFVTKIENIDTDKLYENIVYLNDNLFFYNPLSSNGEDIIRSFDLVNKQYLNNEFVGKTKDFTLRERGVSIVYSKSVWYVLPLGNYLLKLDGTDTYQINCKNFGVSEAMLEKQYTESYKLIKEIGEKQICYGFSSIRETDDFIYFKSNLHDFIRLDKEKKEAEWWRGTKDVENGISDMIYFPHDADDQQIMFIADYDRIENPTIVSEFTETIGDIENEEMNPVLIFYRES